ncbi:12047_t:CDS:2 [Ambispora gerdemannii]|uniref:12047_t:CDS:1 n=1 Tax=Ambispora gerdemannii TaxID=144530 RepID=A0A9N8ZWI7_9GLOM|nr:12047_t:CDS:2 [Ambispora gerdemannii]
MPPLATTQTIRDHPYHKTTSNDERSTCNNHNSNSSSGPHNSSNNSNITSPVTVIEANLDTSGEREKIVVTLNDGVKIEFYVPTSKEIRDRFFYRKAKSSDKPARPPNKFFIFRTMFQGSLDTFKLQVPIVSELASQVWRKSSKEVKEAFSKLAEIAKNEHSEINPGYVYKPYRKVSLTKSDLSSPSGEEESSETSSSPPSPTTPSSSWSSTYLPITYPGDYMPGCFSNQVESYESPTTMYNSDQSDAMFQTPSTSLDFHPRFNSDYQNYIPMSSDACYTTCPTLAPFLSYTPVLCPLDQSTTIEQHPILETKLIDSYSDNIRTTSQPQIEHLQEVKIESHYRTKISRKTTRRYTQKQQDEKILHQCTFSGNIDCQSTPSTPTFSSLESALNCQANTYTLWDSLFPDLLLN